MKDVIIIEFGIKKVYTIDFDQVRSSLQHPLNRFLKLSFRKVSEEQEC